MRPYYEDENVTLYHGDCLALTDLWGGADVLVTDPPYGISWKGTAYNTGVPRASIQGDGSTAARDAVLKIMDTRPGVVFGSPLLAPPPGTRQVLVWHKPPDSGFMGTVGGYRRDWEAVYLVGKWPKTSASYSSVIPTGGTMNAYLTTHPHAKPVELMGRLIASCTGTLIADPFAGSGATLIAARNLGRKAIGVEVEERYCEIIANRLSQGAFDFGEIA